MGSTMARFIVPSRAIFPIIAKCSTGPAVTLGLGAVPWTADNWPVAPKFLLPDQPLDALKYSRVVIDNQGSDLAKHDISDLSADTSWTSSK